MMLQRITPRALVLVAFAMNLTACEAVKGIFKAGVWAGVLMVVIVLGAVGALARSLAR